jgi:hypothetical protein
MKFYPQIEIARIIAITCLIAGMWLAYLSLRQQSILVLVYSAVTFSISYLFLVPVIKNQTIEFIDAGVIINAFGTPVTCSVNDLYQVLKRNDGAISYRFRKGDAQYQVTTKAYHESEKLQEYFNRTFKLDELGVKVIEEFKVRQSQ